MRALFLAVASVMLFACGQTYQQLGTFTCTQDHFCPDTLVCVLINGTGQCLPARPCDLLSSNPSAACPAGTESQDAQRTRCTLLRSSPGVASAQCVHQYGTQPEGNQCQLLFADDPSGGGSGGLNANFPLEDRTCNAGLVCHNFAMATPLAYAVAADGVCRLFCKADTDCGSGQRCLDAFNGNVTTATVSVAPKTGVCVPTCAVLGSPTGCDVGLACTIADNIAANTGQGLCVAPGNAVETGCNAKNLCAAGFACIPDGSFRACKKVCKLSSGNAACVVGETCVASPLVLAEADVGICSK